jgi:hypothetical protein
MKLKAMLENSDRRRELIKVLIDSLALVAVIGYSFISYLQWDALKAANEQTKTALHISTRAYVTMGSPTLDTKTKFINLFMNNVGHIPSGNIEVVIHGVTSNATTPNLRPDTTVESHWKRHKLYSLPPGNDLVGFKVPISKFSESKFTPEGAFQTIVVAGRVVYQDGFPDDGQQEWAFCFSSVYHLTLKQIFFQPCDPALFIPQMERVDGYPANEAND